MKRLKMQRLSSVRLTEATRLRLTENGRLALLTASTCAGCPQCGLPLADVIGMNSWNALTAMIDCYVARRISETLEKL